MGKNKFVAIDEVASDHRIASVHVAGVPDRQLADIMRGVADAAAARGLDLRAGEIADLAIALGTEMFGFRPPSASDSRVRFDPTGTVDNGSSGWSGWPGAGAGWGNDLGTVAFTPSTPGGQASPGWQPPTDNAAERTSARAPQGPGTSYSSSADEAARLLDELLGQIGVPLDDLPRGEDGFPNPAGEVLQRAHDQMFPGSTVDVVTHQNAGSIVDPWTAENENKRATYPRRRTIPTRSDHREFRR